MSEKNTQSNRELDAALSAALEQSGIPVQEDGKPDLEAMSEAEIQQKAPELMMNLIGAVAEHARQVRDEEAAAEEAAAKDDGPLQDVLAGAMQSFVQDHVVPTGAVQEDGTLEIDPAFVKEHGPALINAVIGGIAEALVPKEGITFEVDTKPGADERREEDAGPRKVQVKLDVAKLFGGLIRTKKDSEDGPTGSDE